MKAQNLSMQRSGPKRELTRKILRTAYALMRARFGHLNWWPGDTPFEICVGAILTQNTSWANVEKAITQLKAAQALTPQKLYSLPETELAQLIRPAGYYNLKARRLRCFLEVLINQHDGSLASLMGGDVQAARQRLLAISGIGRETADSMLLYAGHQPSFVIDAYTKRIFARHGWWHVPHQPRANKSTSPEDYESLKQLCETSLKETDPERELDFWQDYHAQIVMVGKHYCRNKEPKCEACPLKTLLEVKPKAEK